MTPAGEMPAEKREAPPASPPGDRAVLIGDLKRGRSKKVLDIRR
jgi:hypothetical protein